MVVNASQKEQESKVNLTKRQRLILAENQSLPNFPCNVEVSILSVEGQLDQDKLATAWATVSRRHDCLRARLEAKSDDIKLVFDDASQNVSFAELSEDHLHDHIRQHCLSFKPNEILCRVLHLRTPSTDQIVVIQDQLVCDDTTKAMIFCDLEAFYTSGDEKQKLLSNFEDYVGSLESEAHDDDAKRYWDEYLASPAPNLKLYGQSPSLARGQLKTDAMSIDAEVAGILMARPDSRSVMTAIAAALLHRITGEEIIPLGVSFANRSADTQSVGGLFVEVAPSRIFVDPAQSLATLANAISSDTEAARPYRQFAVSGANSGHEVVLNYGPGIFEKFAGQEASQAFLTASHYLQKEQEIAHDGSHAGIRIEIFQDNDGLLREVAVHVDRARWPESGIGEDFLRHYAKVLHAMAYAPDTAVGAIALEEADDAADLVLGIALTQPTLNEQTDVHTAIHDRSLYSPDDIAVCFGDAKLTYKTTVEIADTVSAALVARGVAKGDLVAVCLHRSEYLPSVFLGIMGAGAAYVPLNPDHAVSRNEMILEDANPSLMILAPSSVNAFVETEANKVTLDELLHPASPIPDVRLPEADLNSTAYVIFTSGSTGRPKGVQVSHLNLATFISAMSSRPGLSSDTRLAAVTTVTFDISLLEVFGPLVNGGTVVIASEETARNPRALMSLMSDEQINLLQATPATWRMLVEAGWSDQNVTALCGGEALSQPLAESLLERCNAVWNMYGPTETTIWSMVARVQEDSPVTLGTPIVGTIVTLRTEQGALVPRGIFGEINIEGVGVSQGYKGRPDLTAEKFIGEGENRRYRTGDLAAFVTSMEDGKPIKSLQYMGRTDHQVKIRGFRIELGEIEAQINAVAGVSDGIVKVVEGLLDTKALAAYWSGDSSEETRASIKDHLQANLPPYMVPDSYNHVDEFPLNPSGKIDRASLPDPEPARANLGAVSATENQPDIMPKSDMEILLAQHVSEILGLEVARVDIPIRDFGLDSLSHLTLLLRLEQTFGSSLPTNWDEMNIRSLAAAQYSQEATSSVEVPILLRAVLIAAVVAGHFDLAKLPGAVQGLLLVAGHSFGRFLVPTSCQNDSAQPIFRLVGNVLFPTVLAVAFLQVYFGQYTPTAWVLLSNYIPPEQSGHFRFWFVEVMVQNLVILGVLFSFSRVRQIALARPFETALAFLAASFAAMYLIDQVWDTFYLYHRVPQHTMWLMVLGWCVAVANGPRQRWIIIATSVLIMSVVIGVRGPAYIQPAIALALILSFDHIRLPRRTAKAVLYVAAASLFIYLTHFQFLSIVNKLPEPLNSPWLAFPVALAGGVVCYRIWEYFLLLARKLIFDFSKARS